MRQRTDRHNNPTAFITAIAEQAGLVDGVDYEVGDAFPDNPALHTARLLGDPIALTLKVIDAVGFYTREGAPRWNYIAIPTTVWHMLTRGQKLAVIGAMYQREGGTEMAGLFQSSRDSVDHPLHYDSGAGLEALDVIEAFGLGYHDGNAVKYILRAGKKGVAEEDYRKAAFYINRLIQGGRK